MRRKWFGVYVAGLLLALAAVAAAPAQAQSAPQRQQVNGPQTHGPSGLVLPGQLATARIAVRTDFEPVAPGLGVAYGYEGARGTFVDIYIYNKRGTVPDGSDNEAVQAEIGQALGDIDAMVQRGLYSDVNRPAGIGRCEYAGVSFACLMLDFRNTRSDRKLASIVALRGVRGHFVKLRISWPYQDNFAGEEARNVLAAFAAQLAASR